MNILDMKNTFLFDMDGLLIDSESLHLDMWDKTFKDNNVPVDKDVMKQVIGTSGKTAKKIFEDMTGQKDVITKYRTYKENLTKEYLKTHTLHVKKGVYELLEYLTQNHYQIILVSSTKESQVIDYLTRTHLLKYFDKRVCGDQVKHAKPEPDLYLKAIEDYHLDKRLCIALEDSPNGIKACIKADIDVIGIPDLVDISYIHDNHFKGIYTSLLEVLESMKLQYKHITEYNQKIVDLYHEAFPENERIDDELLFQFECIGYYDDKEFIGFTLCANYKNYTNLMYFAVHQNLRGRGYGTEILDILKDIKKDQIIIIDVEKPDDTLDNAVQREKRIQFYLKNNFKPTSLQYTWSDETYLTYTYNGSISHEEVQEFWKEVWKPYR